MKEVLLKNRKSCDPIWFSHATKTWMNIWKSTKVYKRFSFYEPRILERGHWRQSKIFGINHFKLCAPAPRKVHHWCIFFALHAEKKFTENTKCACGNICIYIYLYLFWFNNYYTLGLNFVFGHGNVCWNKGKINKI